LGTWQTTGGNSHFPLPYGPYHSSDKKGTNLVYFDGHGDTVKLVGEDWAQTFPVNRKPPDDP
jgi:hypothetical protein